MIDFVRILSGPERNLGIGKLVSSRGGNAIVEFFNAPSDADHARVSVPAGLIKKIMLPEQARVFKATPDKLHWVVGRVLSDDGPNVLVQFPNRDIQTVSKEDLLIRWRRPIEDPSIFLARMITETPLFADARSAFYRTYVQQRASSLGMGGLLSAQIEIEQHQFEVVQRVLQDPIQRYLLADEVGLGKTIEAGILIRQHFLDDPKNARAIVIVPQALVRQWRGELTTRFSLGSEFDNDTFKVLAHNDLVSIAHSLEGKSGMLVVDEVHHISRKAATENEQLFELLRKYAPRANPLLLLSATPALADEEGFLRVLHLLDPIGFPLDDLTGFRRRIESRRVVAETIAALIPENALILESFLDRLLGEFSGDQLLRGLVDELRLVLAGLPEEDNPKLISQLRRIRSHISETYRLHRRILRNRRQNVLNLTPQRVGIEFWRYDDEKLRSYCDEFEAWRLAIGNSGLLPGDEKVKAVVSAFFESPDRVISCVETCLDSALAEVTDGLIAAATSMRVDRGRIAELKQCLKEYLKNGTKALVYCSSQNSADDVFSELERAFRGAVVRHEVDISDDDSEADAQTWQRFLTDDRCQVLVCDSRAEEGLNLHGGRKVIVHFDLPLSPNRIEQRLGRLDRYGSGEAVRSVALVCMDNRFEAAWAECLEHGFGVFEKSIASLQYLVDSTIENLWPQIVGTGVEAIDSLLESLRGPDGLIERELKRIEQQDMLDSLALEESPALEKLIDVDAEWRSIADAVRRFAVGILQFAEIEERLVTKLPPGDKIARFRYSKDTERDTLLPLQDLIEYFMGAIDFESPRSTSRSPLTFPYTFRRGSAITREALRKGVRLLRYGDAFMDALGSFASSDDRGRVFGLWRYDSDYAPVGEGGFDLYFRFDFLIETDTRSAERMLDGQQQELVNGAVGVGARRRADALLQPLFIRAWINDQLEQVSPVSDAMERTYRSKEIQGKARDFNLSAKRWGVLQDQNIYALDSWPALCRLAHEHAEEYVMKSTEVTSQLDDAIARACSLRDQRIAQLRLRLTRLDGALLEEEKANAALEEGLFEALISGIKTPAVKLDSVGAIFLSNRNPFES